MTPKFILASNSPRRREILAMLGMDFTVIVSDCDENIEGEISPDALVRELAHRKAQAVAEKLNIKGDYIVLGSDTVVWDGKRVLGKPKDKDDAYNTLMSLSGKEHSVFTGIAMIGRIDGREIVSAEAEETKVVFAKLGEGEVRYYVDSNEPMDKAGSYGIQGFGGIFVTELHGDYYNVVGLPLSLMRRMLARDFGLTADDYIGKERK
ncbi:MAG: septum formation inhibitor Maf [Clostridia bacterium]|nr:septum formation inhibitor Maf [Clostridia bacterium]